MLYLTPTFAIFNLMEELRKYSKYIVGKFEITDNGCWNWTGAKDNKGYGKIVKLLAHRVSYATFIGDIDNNKELDHLCRNTICINPKHLEAVTHRENILRSPTAACAVNARKTHCKNGHKYTLENTYNRIRKGRLPERDCLTCRKARNKARQK